MRAIIYTSNTGSTAEYAQLLGNELNLPVHSLQQAKNKVPAGSEIIYLGWIMAGGIKGYKEAAKLYKVRAVCGVGMGQTGTQLKEVRDKNAIPQRIQLWYLPFAADAPLPEFKECARHPHIEEKGYVLYYTSQCPFNAKYVPIVEEVAKENGVSFRAIHLQSKEEAQNAPTPVTTYALFYDGAYLTNEQMNDRKFLKLLSR